MKTSAEKRLLQLLLDKATRDIGSIAADLNEHQLALLAEAVETDTPIMIVGSKKDAMLYRLLKAMGVSVVQNLDTAKEEGLFMKGIYFTIVLPD